MKISKRILSYFIPAVMRVGECGVRCVSLIDPVSPIETPPRRSLDPPGQTNLRLGLGVFSNFWIRIYGFGSPHMLIRRYPRHQDCRDVEDIIARTFSPPDGPSGLIVYVGQRPEYVTSNSSAFRRSQSAGEVCVWCRCLTKFKKKPAPPFSWFPLN